MHEAPRRWQHRSAGGLVEGDVPQCGYCQSGQIMSAASLLSSKKSQPTDTDHRDQAIAAATSAAAEPMRTFALPFIVPRN